MVTSGPARVLFPGKPEQPAFRPEAAGRGEGPFRRLRVLATPPEELPAGCHGDSGREAVSARRGAGLAPPTGGGAGRRACVGCGPGPLSGPGKAEVYYLPGFRLPGLRRGWCAMEGRAAAGGDPDGPRERRGPGDTAGPQQNHQARPQPAVDRLPKHSYWLDLWMFVLVDLVLFLFVYLWP